MNKRCKTCPRPIIDSDACTKCGEEAIEVLKDIVSKPMLYSNHIINTCRVALTSLEAENERLPDDITQRIRGNSGRYDPSRVVKEKVMINIKERCTGCDRLDTCKYSEGYTEFGDRMHNLATKLDGEIIAEGVAQFEMKCKYFKPIVRTPK